MLDFGLAVKLAREQVGWSAKTLSQKADIAQSTLSHIENGDTEMSLKTAAALSKALGLSLADLSDIAAELTETNEAIKELQQLQKTLISTRLALTQLVEN